MISLPDSDDVPVDLFLPPLVALLFLLLLVTYKNWLCILSSSKLLFFCFVFFANTVGDATSRHTNAAGSAVGHAFSRPNTTRVTAHTLIYVSQCEMRHSNPVPQHGIFSAPFPVLSLFVRHSCFACLLPLSIALFDVELCFFVAYFLDLFLSPFCRLIHKLSLCFVVHVVFKIIITFFFSNAVGDAIPCQTNVAGSAVGHAFSRRKKPDLQHKVWVSHFMLAYME